jgi:DNA-binding CsgD family transcriptional regulator
VEGDKHRLLPSQEHQEARNKLGGVLLIERKLSALHLAEIYVDLPEKGITVLDSSYFELAQALHHAVTYDEVESLLLTKLAPMIGADETIIGQEFASTGLFAMSGDGPIAQKSHANIPLIKSLLPNDQFAPAINSQKPGDLGRSLSDAVGKEGIPNLLINKQLYSEFHIKDAIIGLLADGCFRTSRVMCYFLKSDITEEARQKFDAILLTARLVLQRIEFSNVDKVMRQRLFMTRVDSLIAVLIINRAGEILPMNHAAVRHTESIWPEDDPSWQMTENARRLLFRDLESAWQNAVTADWKEVHLDLGNGAIPVFALPKTTGDVYIFLPVQIKPEAGSDPTSGMLTRRQREIMDWIAEGKTSAEAAIILGISPRTVEKHLEAIFQRMGVENRIAAVRRYLDFKRIL